MPPIFVDARDLAGRLDATYETVLTWVRRGKIPHVRDGRGRLTFNLNSIVKALRQNRHQPEAGRPEAVAPVLNNNASVLPGVLLWIRIS